MSMGSGMQPWSALRNAQRRADGDDERRLARGTLRRVAGFARPQRRLISAFLVVVVLDAANPFFASVARGGRDACDRAGLALLLGDSGTDERREGKYVDLFAEQRVNGLLVTPAGSDLHGL